MNADRIVNTTRNGMGGGGEIETPKLKVYSEQQ